MRFAATRSAGACRFHWLAFCSVGGQEHRRVEHPVNGYGLGRPCTMSDTITRTSRSSTTSSLRTVGVRLKRQTHARIQLRESSGSLRAGPLGPSTPQWDTTYVVGRRRCELTSPADPRIRCAGTCAEPLLFSYLRPTVLPNVRDLTGTDPDLKSIEAEACQDSQAGLFDAHSDAQSKSRRSNVSAIPR